MKLAEEEARELERKKQEAEAEKERVRKEIESQKEQSEAAVSFIQFTGQTEYCVTINTDKEG